MLAIRITIIYTNKLETLKKVERENSLPLPRYLVLRAMNKLVVKKE